MNTIVIGAQWGDEGKAKIVDFLAKEHDIIVRFNGGANAGHTSIGEINGKSFKYIFHLMPAGALYENKKCVIGNGVVLDPYQLVKEVEELEKNGVNIKERLLISSATHLVLPWYKLEDSRSDSNKGNKKIGTTGKGIGPAYAKKALRTGLRVGDLLDPVYFKSEMMKNTDIDDIEQITDFFLKFGRDFKENIIDISYFLFDSMKKNKDILFEGAQASFLDIDHGTYPFVTSSNSSAAGACTGSGIGPNQIDRIIGVVKAYTTRVGEGPFITELFDETGEFLQKAGHEFGATTGRVRRCGWLDGVMLKKAMIINGLTDIALTKIDVLTGLDEIKICTGYTLYGKEIKGFPADSRILSKIRPVYEVFPGWTEDITGCRKFENLPENAKKFIKRIEQISETHISIISVGPERNSTITINSNSWG